MSRLAKAVQILEAINKFYQEGNEPLSPYAQILDDDISIKDAIADCVGIEEEPETQYIPRNQRPRIVQNPFTGWSGWVGKRKVAHFENEEQAQLWLSLHYR